MKPIRWNGSWIISAPREQVYDVMTDFENWPRIMPAIVKSAQIIERTGNTVVLTGVFSILGQKGEGVMNIRLDRPNQWSSENDSERLGKELEVVRFEEVKQGTRLSWEVDVRPKQRIVRLIAPALRWPIRWFYERAIVAPIRKRVKRD